MYYLNPKRLIFSCIHRPHSLDWRPRQDSDWRFLFRRCHNECFGAALNRFYVLCL